MTMKEPGGELVELDFYFGNRDRVESYRRVVKYCIDNGGRFAGEILASEGSGIRQRRYAGLYSDPVRVIKMNADELERRFVDYDIDIVKVTVWSAIGITKKVPEIVTYGCISEEASVCDNPSIAIVGEGWQFSTPGYERQAEKMGKRCYQKFVAMCEALDPDYAAILNEDSLSCKYDLIHRWGGCGGGGERCFFDFFISKNAHSANVISEIECLYNDVYTERFCKGLFVSTSSVYNPRGVEIGWEMALERSAKVARMLRAGKEKEKGSGLVDIEDR